MERPAITAGMRQINEALRFRATGEAPTGIYVTVDELRRGKVSDALSHRMPAGIRSQCACCGTMVRIVIRWNGLSVCRACVSAASI
jgi:hypothetical protein